jgi:hypothetical protein
MTSLGCETWLRYDRQQSDSLRDMIQYGGLNASVEFPLPASRNPIPISHKKANFRHSLFLPKEDDTFPSTGTTVGQTQPCVGSIERTNRTRSLVSHKIPGTRSKHAACIMVTPSHIYIYPFVCPLSCPRRWKEVWAPMRPVHSQINYSQRRSWNICFGN